MPTKLRNANGVEIAMPGRVVTTKKTGTMRARIETITAGQMEITAVAMLVGITTNTMHIGSIVASTTTITVVMRRGVIYTMA